MRKTMRTACVQ